MPDCTVNEKCDFFEWQFHGMPFLSEHLKQVGATGAIRMHKIVNVVSGEVFYDGYDERAAYAEWTTLTEKFDDYSASLQELLRMGLINATTPKERSAVEYVLKFHQAPVNDD